MLAGVELLKGEVPLRKRGRGDGMGLEDFGKGEGLGFGVGGDVGHMEGEGKVYGSLRRLPLITLGVCRLPL